MTILFDQFFRRHSSPPVLCFLSVHITIFMNSKIYSPTRKKFLVLAFVLVDILCILHPTLLGQAKGVNT